MLAHIHIMKTAGQTICGILRQSYPGSHCDLVVRRPAMAKDIHWARRFYPDLKSIAGHCVVPYSDLRALGFAPRYFTFLRDPIERCVSHYQFSVQKNQCRQSLDEWLINHANYQTRILCKSEDAQQAIDILEREIGFVGLVERFNESLILLRQWSGAAGMDIRYHPRNIATDNRIKKRILSDPLAVRQIRQAHEHDCTVYAHVRDVIYPRQMAEFGAGLDCAREDLENSLPGPIVFSFTQMAASMKRNMLYKPLTRTRRKAA